MFHIIIVLMALFPVHQLHNIVIVLQNWFYKMQFLILSDTSTGRKREMKDHQLQNTNCI